MTLRTTGTGGLAALMMLAGGARADIASVAAGGFDVHEQVRVAVGPDQAYAMLLTPSRWWNSDHTFSKSAANLTLEARAGGCWCEKLPDGGSVEHMRVVWAAPGKVLRLRGALGPFQGLAVDGVLTFTLKPIPEGSEVVLNYTLGGYNKDGFENLAKITDQVMAEQLERFKKALER